MKISINGINQEEKEGTSLKKLLKSLGLDSARVAVELNKEIVKKDKYSEITLKNGDALEIVHFVGGG